MTELSDTAYVLLDYGERIVTRNVHLLHTVRIVRRSVNALRKEPKIAIPSLESVNADLGIMVLSVEEDVL